jgi:hypothetical protein
MKSNQLSDEFGFAEDLESELTGDDNFRQSKIVQYRCEMLTDPNGDLLPVSASHLSDNSLVLHQSNGLTFGQSLIIFLGGVEIRVQVGFVNTASQLTIVTFVPNQAQKRALAALKETTSPEKLATCLGEAVVTREFTAAEDVKICDESSFDFADPLLLDREVTITGEEEAKSVTDSRQNSMPKRGALHQELQDYIENLRSRLQNRWVPNSGSVADMTVGMCGELPVVCEFADNPT